MAESQEESRAPSSRWQRFAEGLDRALCTAGRWLGSKWVTYFLVLVTACVYLGNVPGIWNLHPDGGLYLSLGRSLARGEGYTYLGEPHVFALPGLPMILALAMKLGLGEIWQLNLLFAFMALALCWGTWLLARLISNAVIANLSVLFLALADTTLYWSRFILTEIPFMLASVAALICITLAYRRDKLSVAWGCGGASLGVLATLIRPNGVVLFAAFMAWLWLTVPKGMSRWKRCVLTAAFCVAALGPLTWWVARAQRYSRPYATSYSQLLLQETKASRYFRELCRMPKKLGGILTDGSLKAVARGDGRNAIGLIWPLAVLGGMVVLLRRRQPLLPVVIVGQCLAIAFWYAGGRYLFVIYPMAIVASLVGVAALLQRKLPGCRIVAALLLCILFARCAVAAIQDSGKFRFQGRRWARDRDYRVLADYLRGLPKSTRIYSGGARAIHFQSERHARRLPKGLSAESFPSFYCYHGGFNLLVVDAGSQFPADADVLRMAKRMERWGALHVRRLQVRGLNWLTVYELATPSGPRDTLSAAR